MREDRVIDVVIPTFHPDHKLLRILELLKKQKNPVRCVRIINSGREGFEQFLKEENLTEESLRESFPFLVLEHIPAAEFDHGGTRSRAFSECGGADYILAMTQDALPADGDLTRRLREGLEQAEDIAVSYARQLPNPDASCEERISREFNYPDEPLVKSQEDVKRLGIKTYFCSNVCAMYRREIWEKLGGFPKKAIFNEDMIYAGKALQAGYRICYAAKACVYHSHSYTARQQFHRNFDLGVSQAQNPQIFGGLSSEGEGMHYVKAVIRRMKQEHELQKVPGVVLRCAARLLGYRLGKAYEKLPGRLVLACSSNQSFWKETHSE